MPEQLRNFARSTLVSGIDEDDTEFDVTDGSNFPTADAYIVCDFEIMRLVSRDGDTLTVIRGDEETDPVAHDADAPIGGAITVAGLTAFIQEVVSGSTVIGDLTVNRTLKTAGVIRPTLSGTTHNWAPTNIGSSSVVFVDPGGSNRTLTGITTGAEGRVLLLANAGTSGVITLVNDSPDSTVGNRFALPVGSSMALPVGSFVILVYDDFVDRWRVTGRTSPSGSTSTLTVGGSSSNGSSNTFARGDHSHGITNPKLDDLATPDDNTDLNATTGQHGLLPKLGGGTTNFLRADGSWSEPPGTSDLTSLHVESISGAHDVDRADGATHDLTLAGDATITPTHSNPPDGESIDLRVRVRQALAGSPYALNIEGVAAWAGGFVPEMPTEPGAAIDIGFLSLDGAENFTGYSLPGDLLTEASHAEIDHEGIPGVGEGGGGGLATGTAFPGEPSTGDRFRRSDLDYIVFFWDGTRWLSEQLLSLAFTCEAMNATGAFNRNHRASLPHDFDVFVERVDIMTRMSSTDGSNYWTVQLQKHDLDANYTDIVSVSLQGDTGAKYVGHDQASVNHVIDTGTSIGLRAFGTKTGATPELIAGITAHFRLIAE